MAKMHMTQEPHNPKETLEVIAPRRWKKVVSGLWEHICRVNLEPVYRFIARWSVRGIYHLKVHNGQKLPLEGPAILICNHISYMDGVVINSAMRHPVRYIIDKYIYRLPVLNYFMRLNRGIPIAPTRDDVAAALDEISSGLKNGDIICIFPEGQMTYTGNLGRFRPGIEWILQRDPVPVYPMALKGLWGSMLSRKYRKAKKRFGLLPFRRRVDLICGDPLAPEEVTVDKLQKIVMELRNSVPDR